MKKTEELWCNIRDLIRIITKKSDDYDKKCMKIKFNTDVKWPLNKAKEIPSMMGRDSFLVYWAIFLMRNMCFQSKRRAAFQFIKLSSVSYFCNSETCVFKSSRRMHFSLFSNFCNTKTCLFKTIDRLLFSLFSSFCNSEACVHLCRGFCWSSFLVYVLLIVTLI